MGSSFGSRRAPSRRALFFRRNRATTAACERSSDIQERDWNAREGPKADIRSWLERCASSTGTAFVSLYRQFPWLSEETSAAPFVREQHDSFPSIPSMPLQHSVLCMPSFYRYIMLFPCSYPYYFTYHV